MGSNEPCKKQPCASISWHIILKIAFYLGKLFYLLVQRIHITLRIQLNIVAPYFLIQDLEKFNGEQSPQSKKPASEGCKGTQVCCLSELEAGRAAASALQALSTSTDCSSMLYHRDDTPAHSVSQCTVGLGGLALAFCMSL